MSVAFPHVCACHTSLHKPHHPTSCFAECAHNILGSVVTTCCPGVGTGANVTVAVQCLIPQCCPMFDAGASATPVVH